MLGKTVSSHFDDDLANLLEGVSKAEGHAPSRVVSTGARSLLSMSPPARRAAITMDGSVTQAERDLLAKFVSRTTVLAYQAILEERNLGRIREADGSDGTTSDLCSEEDIEAEAARLCAT